ncbi:hypothetical protein WHR41_07247 [Cladosporium halotolerans]|uniref:Uncharacterized protein n=1 Tax=Cladosporium halotolerans TaxID=1052096 RepID=A0AB34KGU1_9PEZI
MSSNAVSKKADQQVAPSRTGQVETHEESAKASASAGLNLNIFGALSGVFSGKSTKETAADGSSVEHRDDKAAMKGAGKGNLSAAGAAAASDNKKSQRAQIEDK